MNMKKKVIILSLFIIIQILFVGINTCFADDVLNPESWKPSETQSDGTAIIDATDDKDFTDKVNVVLTAIRNIGIIVSVAAVMVIGIKFMLGSVEEKAEYKKMIPGYLIGTFLVFAVTVLPDLIYNIMQNV